MSRHIIDDAKRCLLCKNPLCSAGCPVNTPIKEAISLLLKSELTEAGKILFENNPLSIVCSHICPQEYQCEGHCVLGKKGIPVHISAIERYISDYYLNIYKPTPSLRNRGKVAIIGSGPSGITIALTLAKKNYDVTIFEGNDKIGGILRYGIPEFRLPKNIMDRLCKILIGSGVKIRPNTSIGANLTVDDLFRDEFRAVFIGTGVWRPRKLDIKGESLGHVHFAIEYLKNPDVYNLGKALIVIGAGNVSMDVARTAIRHGCQDVLIVCNLDESDVSAREVEVQYARIDGAKIELKKTAIEITDNGVIFADSEIYIDEYGNKQTKPIPGTEKLYPADSVIVAISQGPRSVIVSSTTGISVNDNGLVAVDNCGHTSREGVFAGGDVVTGAKTVVQAVVVSQLVAKTIDEYISSKYPV
ncbi:MAG: NAD(P)-dependent oxidoreductase [Treponema sp.]|jgi:glutamate synthase (NADPH/NADH) small chain|nr:NAD(P)-dependent oxidoreductase [Treponema sp.]